MGLDLLTERPVHVGFVLEQALGHVAFGMGLRNFLSRRTDMRATWLEIPFEPGPFGRVPVIGKNWTIRGSVRARNAIAQAHRRDPFDALFIHTQTIAVLSGHLMTEIPTLLSLDATPKNYDELASAYEASTHPQLMEWLKLAVHRRVMRRATRFAVWSEWAKSSLVKHYEVPASLVDVVHPGTDLASFPPPEARQASEQGPLRVLFVGGDFKRKGGDLLVQVCQQLGSDKVELNLVTSAQVPEQSGIRVHHNVKPLSKELFEHYAHADVFVLPTRGDCLALVLGEAMASSLPIIATRVGGLAEEILEGETGYYMDVDDGDTLRARLELLHQDRQLLKRLGRRSREFGEERFDGEKNAHRIGDIVVDLARRSRH